VLARPILNAWVGPAIAARSTDLLRVLAIAYAGMALTAIPSNAADALGRPDIAARYSLASLAINATLAVVLIPRYGIMGSGLAILGNVLIQSPWFVRAVTASVVRAPLGAYLRRAVVEPLLPAAIAAAVVWPGVALGLARGLPGVAALVAAGTIAFGLAVRWLRIFDAAEREIIAGLPGGRVLRWLVPGR